MKSLHLRSLLVGAIVLAACVPGAAPAAAQTEPNQRQLRTYIPPDQLVSFLPSTPFTQFVEYLNPIFERVTGKQIVDPYGLNEAIGVPIRGYYFLDALELVLETKGLRYRETDEYFVVEEIPENDLVASAAEARAGVAGAAVQETDLPASIATREIQINAVLFELDHNRARDLGIDWNVFFGGQTGAGSGGGNTGGESGGVDFRLRTDDLFDGLGDVLSAPDEISLSQLTQFFRLLESEGAGETIANPQVTVQSGEEGRIQIGSDIPVQIRDFSGNTVTQFYATGIIVDVVPTVIRQPVADTTGAPEVDFIHLDVTVEKSTGRPSFAGIAIDRNQATTQVLLLDGEQTIIGGLYSTDEVTTRRGVPILKDLPGWFFGLRYIFGYEHTTTTQKELLMVLQAELLDPLQVRAQRPFEENLLEKRRRQIEESLERTSPELIERAPLPR